VKKREPGVEYAKNILEEHPDSVLSGRSLEEISGMDRDLKTNLIKPFDIELISKLFYSSRL
jgi:hypothetical protein